MIYEYLGKEVQVTRFSGNDTAQLSDGTWVPSGMLQSIKLVCADPINESALEIATKKRAKVMENN